MYEHGLERSRGTGYLLAPEGVGRTRLQRVIDRASGFLGPVEAFVPAAEYEHHGPRAGDAYVRVGSYSGRPSIKVRACEPYRRELLKVLGYEATRQGLELKLLV